LIRITDVGPTGGTQFRWDGTIWRLTAPMDIVWDITVSVSGTTGVSEQILKQATIPSGLLQAGRTLEIYSLFIKSGTTDSSTTRVRLGTAGTTADAQIFSNQSFPNTGRSITAASTYVLPSTTQIRVASAQNAGAAAPWANASTATASPVNTTIPDISSNALIVSCTQTMSGSTDTPQVAELFVRLYP
jgi:hypothetical protein